MTWEKSHLNDQGLQMSNKIIYYNFCGNPEFHESLKQNFIFVVRNLTRCAWDFPTIAYRVASFLYIHDESSYDNLKRQTWNTFVAHPIELCASLVGVPTINYVGYQRLCLDLDYDYYLTEAELKQKKHENSDKVLKQKYTIFENKLSVKEGDITAHPKIWDLIKAELIENSVLEVVVKCPFHNLVLPNIVALKFDRAGILDELYDDDDYY
jgi:hypothetical protein